MTSKLLSAFYPLCYHVLVMNSQVLIIINFDKKVIKMIKNDEALMTSSDGSHKHDTDRAHLNRTLGAAPKCLFVRQKIRRTNYGCQEQKRMRQKMSKNVLKTIFSTQQLAFKANAFKKANDSFEENFVKSGVFSMCETT